MLKKAPKSDILRATRHHERENAYAAQYVLSHPERAGMEPRSAMAQWAELWLSRHVAPQVKW